MADDTEISNGIKRNLNEAAAEPCGLLNNIELKDPTENKDTTASPPSSADSQADGSSRASPDPSCSICLGKLQNKSFTDGCYHTFCFACLVEWSKVKAVCPLCKVKFKSIVHNVRSNDDYDQYYIGRTAHTSRESSHDPFRWTENRRFRYATTRPSVQESEIRISVLQYQQHRCTYAPHSVRLHPTRSAAPRQERSQEERRNMQFRRRVYDQNLWAKSTASKVSTCSPAFYTANPACTHRLVPWLTRELIVLLDNEERVRFVLDFMMSLILRYSILSEEFFLHIEPYLGDLTSHFVHEFYNFATCIYDIDRYDELMQYHVQAETSMSSPGSDVIAVDSAVDSDSGIEDRAQIASASSTVLSSRFLYSPSSRFQKQKRTEQKPLTVYLKKSHESNSWNVWRPSSPLSPSYSLPEDLSLPSSSRARNDLCASTSGISAFQRVTPPLVTLSSSEEGECAVVEELKPRYLRTPEVIEVSSSPEIDVERPCTPASPDLEPVSDGSLGIVDPYDSDGNPFVLDNSSPVVINVPDSSQITLHDDSSCNTEENTIDYSMSLLDERRRSRKPKFPERSYYPTPWSPNERSRWSSSSSSSHSRSREKRVRSWSQERDRSVQQFLIDNKRRSLNTDSALRFSANSEYGESSKRLDATTSSDRDNRYSSSSGSNVKKRVKLRSVVKRSSRQSDSSNHSHRSKKPKSKKKKRKKGERHRHHKH